MDKVKMTTPDGVTENIEKLGALFPAAVTEMRGEDGTLRKGIDFEKLRQLLSRDIVEGGERYEFSWVGKKAAMAEAARPTTETLRPVKADSRDWDTTENLYIEGDNLAALKILQESYLGKVKMIYIDPPYNTGNDFIYADDFMRTQDEENEQMGMFDEDENHLFKNTDSNGRFHSDWCSMIYSRLLLARNLLADDGLVFISIDDNEVDELKKICNEIMGYDNFINSFVWQRNSSAKTERGKFTVNTEYILLYARSYEYQLNDAYKPLSEASQKLFKFDDEDGRGKYQTVSLQKPRDPGPETTYDYVDNSGKVWPCPPKGWRMKREKIKALENDNRLVLTGNTLRVKDYWNERDNEGKRIDTLWNDLSQNTAGSNELRQLFDVAALFDNPKPIDLIKRCLEIGSKTDLAILDFFSGSATTAHAVMQLNAEDGGHRKFIMVQLPEPCDEKSEAYKAGYKNICEIGKERIRRAGDKIKAEHPDADLDIGFRVFRVDSSNMRDVYYKPEEFTQTMLGETVSNIKPDRTDLDLLYACLLDCGVPIHLPHTTTTVDGCTIHNVDNGALMACFDEHIPHSVIRAMAAEAPLQVIFRDSAFAADADKINVTEIFKNLSPDTKVRVI